MRQYTLPVGHSEFPWCPGSAFHTQQFPEQPGHIFLEPTDGKRIPVVFIGCRAHAFLPILKANNIAFKILIYCRAMAEEAAQETGYFLVLGSAYRLGLNPYKRDLFACMDKAMPTSQPALVLRSLLGSGQHSLQGIGYIDLKFFKGEMIGEMSETTFTHTSP